MANYLVNLKKFFNGELKENHIELTHPKKYLQECGIPAIPIIITTATLREKVNKHGLTLEQLKYLNNLVNFPIMVFHSLTVKDSFIIVLGAFVDEGLLSVAIHPNKTFDKMVVNDIATIGGRNWNQILNWIESEAVITAPTIVNGKIKEENRKISALIRGNEDKIKKVLTNPQFNSAKFKHHGLSAREVDYVLQKINQANKRLLCEITKESSKKNYNKKK